MSLQLFLSQDENALKQGSVAVSWCVSPELVAKLAELYVTDPYIVFVVAPLYDYQERWEFRKVVPLTDAMTYLEFRRPGLNRIHAFILDSRDKDHRSQVSSIVHARVDRKFNTTLLSSNGETVDLSLQLNSSYRWMQLLIICYATASTDIEVPQEVFAKPLSTWESAWITYWWGRNGTPVDLCDRRKMWPLYLLLGPLWLLFYAARLLVVMALLLCGMRRVDFGPLRHPLTQKMSYIWSDLRRTVFWPDLDRFKGLFGELVYAPRMAVLAFTPALLLLLFGFSFLIRIAEGLPPERAMLDAATMTVIVPLIIASGMIAFTVISVLVMTMVGVGIAVNNYIGDHDISMSVPIPRPLSRGMRRTKQLVRQGVVALDRRVGEWHGRQTSARPVALPWYERAEDVQLIACTDAAASRHSITDLPPARRTFRLRFEAAKARVCRPFAAS